MKTRISSLLMACFLLGGSAVFAQSIAETRAKAEQGDASAQFFLGSFYALGAGVLKDDVEAVKWYRKSAEQGDDSAQ